MFAVDVVAIKVSSQYKYFHNSISAKLVDIDCSYFFQVVVYVVKTMFIDWKGTVVLEYVFYKHKVALGKYFCINIW